MNYTKDKVIDWICSQEDKIVVQEIIKYCNMKLAVMEKTEKICPECGLIGVRGQKCKNCKEELKWE